MTARPVLGPFVLLNCQRTRRTGPPSPIFPKEGEGFEPSRPFLTEPSALATRRVNPLCQPSVHRRLSAPARRGTGEQLSSRPQWDVLPSQSLFPTVRLLYCSTVLFAPLLCFSLREKRRVRDSNPQGADACPFSRRMLLPFSQPSDSRSLIHSCRMSGYSSLSPFMPRVGFEPTHKRFLRPPPLPLGYRDVCFPMLRAGFEPALT